MLLAQRAQLSRLSTPAPLLSQVPVSKATRSPVESPLANERAELALKRREAQREMGFHSEAKNDQLDGLSKILASYLEASTAMVSVYTEDTIFIKSSFGLAEDHPRQFPLRQSLGMFATASEHPQIVAVPDALLDSRCALAAGTGSDSFCCLW